MSPDPRPPRATGAVSRHAAYTLVAQYLAAVPPVAGDDDVRVWRAVDLALDATGLPPMTAPALTGTASAAGRTVTPNGQYEGPKGEHADCTWGEGCRVFPNMRHEFVDDEAPRWRALVLDHGLDAARDAVIARVMAGGTITDLPSSWEDHLAWMRDHDLEDQVEIRHRRVYGAAEGHLIHDKRIPAYAVAAILCRRVHSVEYHRGGA